MTAPIVGVTKTRHLDDAIASLRITLTDAELAMLTDRYVPRLPEDLKYAMTTRRWRRAVLRPTDSAQRSGCWCLRATTAGAVSRASMAGAVEMTLDAINSSTGPAHPSSPMAPLIPSGREGLPIVDAAHPFRPAFMDGLQPTCWRHNVGYEPSVQRCSVEILEVVSVRGLRPPQ